MKRLVILLSTVAAPVLAQDDTTVSVTLGFGVGSTPDYFGAATSNVGVTGSAADFVLTSPLVSFGGGDPNGFGFSGSARLIAARNAEDYTELTGLNDIDTAFEIGGGISYTDLPTGSRKWGSDSFLNVRYGVVGHEAWVGEVGSDLVYAPTQAMTFTFGPRLFAGADDFASTYFGITPDEAATSSFTAFDAGGGVLGRGVEATATYDFNETWGVVGTITYEEFLNDAARSPIVQQGSADQLNMSLIVTRAINFSF